MVLSPANKCVDKQMGGQDGQTDDYADRQTYSNISEHVNGRGQAEWKLWDSHESPCRFWTHTPGVQMEGLQGHQHRKAVFLPFQRSE